MDGSPFGRIPPELRNRIYGYVFDERRMLLFGDPNVSGTIQHPLTATCKAIRAETLLMDCNRTLLLDYDGNRLFPGPWLQRIGLNACQSLAAVGGRIWSLPDFYEEKERNHRRGLTVQVVEEGASAYLSGCATPCSHDYSWAVSALEAIQAHGLRLVTIWLGTHKHQRQVRCTVLLRPGQEIPQ